MKRNLFLSITITLILAFLLHAGSNGYIYLYNEKSQFESIFLENESIIIKISDNDLNTNPQEAETTTVSISSSKETKTLTLTEEGVNTNRFKVSLQVSSTESTENILKASDGDTLKITYQDELSSGDTAITVTKDALFKVPGSSDLHSKITENLTLNKDKSPYRIIRNLIIDNTSLTIEPGVTVTVDPQCTLIISGLSQLTAKGTVQDSIHFRSSSKTPNPEKYWHGIKVSGSGSNGNDTFLDIEYVSIKHCKNAISGNICSHLRSSLSHITIDSILDWALTFSGTGTNVITDNFILEESNITAPNGIKYIRVPNTYITLNLINNTFNATNIGMDLEFYNKHKSTIKGNTVIGTNKSSSYGMYLEDTRYLIANNNTIKGFNTGIFTMTPASHITTTFGIIEGTTISDCKIGSHGATGFSNCNFINIDSLAIKAVPRYTIIARNNYWGEELTKEIEEGASVNISGFHDYYDDGTLGKIDYLYHLTEPYAELKFSTQPEDVSEFLERTATFAVEVEGGSGNTKYQWYKADGTIIGDAKSKSYSVTVTKDLDSTGFYCIANDDVNQAISQTAYLTVKPYDVSVDTSVSIDTTVNTAKDTLITEIITITRVTTIPFNDVSILHKNIKDADRSMHFAPNPIRSYESLISVKLPNNLNGMWSISIYDAVGNLQNYSQFSSNEKNTFSWNLHNLVGRKVASGSYVAVMQFTGMDGSTKLFKSQIGVKTE